MNDLTERLLNEAQRLTDEAGVLWNAGSFPGTEALCRQALELTRRAVGDDDRRVAESLYNLAALYHFQRRFEEAKPLYREAIRIHEAQEWVDHAALAFCYAWLAKTHFEGWRDDPGVDGEDDDRSFQEAEACYRKALALLERLGETDTPEYAGCLLQLGFLFFYCDRYAEAEPLFVEALRLRESIFGPDHLETAEAAGRLAVLYLQDPDSQADPEPLLRRALSIRRDRLDAADPDVWEWTYRLAEFCGATGRQREADMLYSRLGRLLLQDVEAAPADVDWIVQGYLDYLLSADQAEQAAAIEARWCGESPNVRVKRHELNRRETMFGPEHPHIAETLVELADDLRFEERCEEALPLYRRALTILETADGLKSPTLLPVLNGMAMLHRAEDAMRAAEEVLKRACSIPYEPASPADTLQYARAVEQLAWVRSTDESAEEADALFRRAIALIEGSSPRDNREAAEMHYRFSIFLAHDARYVEAEQSIRAALQAAESTDDLDPLEIADYREQYAAILVELNLPEQAAAQFAAVKRIWSEAGSPREDL